MRGVHNTIGDIRCHFPHIVKKRSVEENNNNAFITGYEISVSNNNRNFSVSHMMYILDSTCQDTLNVSGELRFVLKVYAYNTYYNRFYHTCECFLCKISTNKNANLSNCEKLSVLSVQHSSKLIFTGSIRFPPFLNSGVIRVGTLNKSLITVICLP